MKTEDETRAIYDELLDNLGHTVNLTPTNKIMLESQVEILEEILEIRRVN